MNWAALETRRGRVWFAARAIIVLFVIADVLITNVGLVALIRNTVGVLPAWLLGLAVVNWWMITKGWAAWRGLERIADGGVHLVFKDARSPRAVAVKNAASTIAIAGGAFVFDLLFLYLHVRPWVVGVWFAYPWWTAGTVAAIAGGIYEWRIRQ